MVTSGLLRSSAVWAAVKTLLSARPNRHTLVLEYSTKSTTASRSGVSARGVMLISTWLAARTGTLVSCETSTGLSCTLSSLAYWVASSQAGPDQSAPFDVVFWISQGG